MSIATPAQTRVTPHEAHAKMTHEGFTYIDVRTESEFAEGHPAGAINIPVMIPGPNGLTFNTEFTAQVQRRFAPDARLIVGCKMGGRSARAADELGRAGFQCVLDQSAGWDGTRGPFGEIVTPGWSRCDLPKG